MEIEQLRFFIEVCRTKSFSDAADKLFVSQPTISKKIMALESELGVVLFSRQKHSVTPTAAGLYLRDRAEKIISLADEAAERTRAIGAGKEGSLRIGISDQLDINGIMPGFLREFIVANPTLDVSVSIHKGLKLAQLIASGDLDAAFMPYTGDSFYNAGIGFIPVNRACPRLYYSVLHPKARRPRLSASDFQSDTLLTLGGENTETTRQLKKAGIVFRNVMILESMQTLKLYVEANMGVTVLGVSQNLCSYDRILSIPLPLEGFKVGTDCVFNEHSDNTCVPIFCEAVRNYLKI